jgi:hypothetical protein
MKARFSALVWERKSQSEVVCKNNGLKIEHEFI